MSLYYRKDWKIMRKKLCAFIMSICLLVSMMPTIPASASSSDQILKIGLYYGTTALPSANLANEVGSGYSLGYFDSNRVFVSLFSIPDEKFDGFAAQVVDSTSGRVNPQRGEASLRAKRVK